MLFWKCSRLNCFAKDLAGANVMGYVTQRFRCLFFDWNVSETRRMLFCWLHRFYQRLEKRGRTPSFTPRRSKVTSITRILFQLSPFVLCWMTSLAYLKATAIYKRWWFRIKSTEEKRRATRSLWFFAVEDWYSTSVVRDLTLSQWYCYRSAKFRLLPTTVVISSFADIFFSIVRSPSD